jgi:hypothetical protein
MVVMGEEEEEEEGPGWDGKERKEASWTVPGLFWKVAGHGARTPAVPVPRARPAIQRRWRRR